MDVPAFQLPPELADADTIGVIYDETDGLNFYNEYGMLRELFAARFSRPTSGTRTCCADTCGRRRSARCRFAAWPPPTPSRSTRCFRRSSASRVFTWAEHGQALLRQRKPWYYEYEHEPRPDIAVIGARLSQLMGR